MTKNHTRTGGQSGVQERRLAPHDGGDHRSVVEFNARTMVPEANRRRKKFKHCVKSTPADFIPRHEFRSVVESIVADGYIMTQTAQRDANGRNR